jgi:hypothetical protein
MRQCPTVSGGIVQWDRGHCKWGGNEGIESRNSEGMEYVLHFHTLLFRDKIRHSSTHSSYTCRMHVEKLTAAPHASQRVTGNP